MTIALDELTTILNRGDDLSASDVVAAISGLLDDGVDEKAKATFLRALRVKGESAAELASFAKAMLSRAIDPQIEPARLSGPMLDVCGTGGDRAGLFNVSTTSMFVLAAGGVTIVKHGNRGITSQCGGADVLEALGVKIDLPAADLKRCVEEVGAGFLFAPLYHPAFAKIAPVRRQLAAEGETTIFNLLGPLLNPARPERQLIGIFSAALLDRFAEALRILGRKRVWVLHGEAGEMGLDEISTAGATTICEIDNGKRHRFTLRPEQFKIARAEIEELRGGDKNENVAILLGIVEGTITDARRDIVVLNSAAGFVVAGIAADLEEGISLAHQQLDSGAAARKLQQLRQFRT